MNQPVDTLIRHGAIITMNPHNDVLDDGAIAIKGNRIIAIGSTSEINPLYSASKTIEADQRIIMPGLVDVHFHTAQQLERGMLNHLAKRGKLKEPIWQNYLIPFEASLTDEDIHLSALFAYANLLKSGTTCFADAGGPRPEVIAPAVAKSGIRGVLARSTLDHQDSIPIEMRDNLAGIRSKGETFFNEWHGQANGRISVWMGMRQILVCSEELLREIKQLADDLNTGLHIHLAEGSYEVEYAIQRTGLRPAEYLESLGFLGPNVHAAHSVLLSERELDLYQEYDVSVAHCPSPAFTFIGATRVPDMLKRGIRVGIGTDGALIGSLDLFQQMMIAYSGIVTSFGLPYYDRNPIAQERILRLATLGGAQSLHLDQEIGSLEVGKKADLILLARDDLNVLPAYDPVYVAASNANASQVRTVLVDGKVVVEDGRLLCMDEDELKIRIQERAPKIVARFLERAG